MATALLRAARGCQALQQRVTSTLPSLQLLAWAPLSGASGACAAGPSHGAGCGCARCSLGQPAAHARFYSTEGGNEEDDDLELRVTERVRRLADEIVELNLLEISDLTALLSKKLGVSDMPMMGFPMGGMPGMAAGAPAAGGAAAEEAPKVEEKTEFDVKLDGFDAAAKIKVIKEIRGITGLGLKESKELVEGAPAVIKKGVSKAEAEELQKKLEAAGAKIVLG